MSRSGFLFRPVLPLALVAACSSAPSVDPGAAAAGGGGAAGTGEQAGAPAAGVSGAAGSSSLSGAANVAGSDAGGASSGGSADAGGAGLGASGGGMTPNDKILIYTKATGFVHESTPTATTAISQAASAAGFLPEHSEDPAKFAPAQLAQYGALVLIATTGEPFGSPGTAQIQALVEYVTNGGGLVAIENANHAYDDSVPYISLIGADFNGHPAFGPDTCYTVGSHSSVALLAPSFPVTDEIYYFTKFNPKNQVVLRCGADKRPISWVREEGAGRVFYTALGHDAASWTKPPLVDSHVLPGLRWVLKR